MVAAPGGSSRRFQVGYRVLQVLIALVLALAVVRGNVPAAVNATLGLGVTFLPAVLERDHRITLPAGIATFLTATLLLHSLGMLGLYDGVAWWDHLTHVLSASIVAGVGYSTAVALARHSESVHFPPQFLFVYVIVFTLAFGVVWEVLEFVGREVTALLGVDPVLVQYGLEDTMLDLVFDAVGAVAFSVAGTRPWSTVVESIDGWLDRREDAEREG